MRGLRARAPAAVFVQRPGVVSELRGPADDGARRASGGRGAAVGAGAPVGADGAVSAALPDGVESRAEPRGAAGVHARAARRVRARRPRARHCRVADRHGHGAAARGRGVEHATFIFTPSCWTGCSPKRPGARWRFTRRRGRATPRSAAALATIRHRVQRLLVRRGLAARRRRDGAGGSPRGRVPRAGGDRRGLGAGAGGAGLTRGGAGAAARRCARHTGRDVARGAAGAPGRVRPARQRVGVGERSGGGGAFVPIRLASALRAGAPAAAGRRAHRAGAQDGRGTTGRGSWCSSRWSSWSVWRVLCCQEWDPGRASGLAGG